MTPTRFFFAPLAAILALGVASCDSGDTNVVISGEPPYYSSLDDVAAASGAIVQGTVTERIGVVELKGVEAPISRDIYAFSVETILGQADGATLKPGDVIQVSIAAASARFTGASNAAEFRTEVASFSTPLETGALLTLFLARRGSGDNGWSVVGSNYGVVRMNADGMRSVAPLGPLAGKEVRETDLQGVLSSLGRSLNPER